MNVLNTNVPPLNAFPFKEMSSATGVDQSHAQAESLSQCAKTGMIMDSSYNNGELQATIDCNERSANFNGNEDKRKSSSDDDLPEAKKSLIITDEKKIGALRKNIRDVMDENQLDTTTIAAQREESERLARVAEQQKIIREYQRQTAVNRQFVRTQNRVLSLLQSGNTFAKITDVSTRDSTTLSTDIAGTSVDVSASVVGVGATAATASLQPREYSAIKDSGDIHNEKILEERIALTEPVEAAIASSKKPNEEVVTIEDSSSEDDCILLSDDEEEPETEETEEDPTNSGLHVKDTYNVPDEHGRVVVNIGHPEGEEDIYVAPQIAKTIKPHQIGGVRFLYDNIIESTKRFKTSSGFGCILAHSMGLGKTLQVVCFCDIFLRHTHSKTVLCVMPINTLQNWVSEFNMWIPRHSDNPEELRPRQFDVYVLNDQQKTLSARAKVILKWANEGGVLLIGYELFRLLALKLMSTRKRRSAKFAHSDRLDLDSNKNLMDSIHQALVKPGPDLVICDEGHRIKNAHAGISLALKQIRTRRRIVLTGYPLQNNLLEYWCMVDFVRPNYLGTRTEFCNMFERPIQNGQCSDSTPEDIKLMRYRAHVLHSLLVGFVQRRSHVVLQQTLPQKVEFVILTRMTSFQRSLYDTFMNDIVRSKAAPNPLKAFAVCCKIWNHPDVLYNFLRKRETDLDLEIYEGEASNETNANANPNTNAASSKNKITEVNIAPPTSINITNPPVQDTESQKSNVNILKHEVQSSETSSMDHSLKAEPPRTNADPNLTNKNQNLYYFGNCYQSNNEPLYPSDCNDNNYWQDANATYFVYPPVTNNIAYPFKPNYVEIVNEKNIQSDFNNRKEHTSSEIVDLDTKEIKTIETSINMEQSNIALKEKDDAQSNCNSMNSQGLSSGHGQIPNETIKDIKQLDANSERDILKVKTDDGIPYEWAIDLMKGYKAGLISNSPKMEIFFCILNESIRIGDRVLLFSQSLLTLNLIENFLQSNEVPGSNCCWVRGQSYFRLDGSTTSQEREKLINEFNNNFSIKLFLISTRAGSLGINLVGANRVVIFDASWNPCHDTQAVYRIYRYGQQKPCFVYRIVMDKCLEKKIYDRQIKKQGMSDRVVDECNPEAHLSLKDVTNLCHDFDEEENDNQETFTQPLESFPDEIIRKILQDHKSTLTKQPFHHESLLVDHKEKKLSQAEKRQAHRGYEMEKKATTKQNFSTTINKFQYRIVRSDGTIVNRPVASIRPMQSTKTSGNIKSASAGGVRSTRWIPAEVWQRQGMTAQEMTLPLDVVIPTNSSDKANIILKAGQRVMVLKSAKGIYMQLDSGKIIAIRTQNKTADQNKYEKTEVIDITSEEGNGSGSGSGSGSSSGNGNNSGNGNGNSNGSGNDVHSGGKSNNMKTNNETVSVEKHKTCEYKNGDKPDPSLVFPTNKKPIKEDVIIKESFKESQVKAAEPYNLPHSNSEKNLVPISQNCSLSKTNSQFSMGNHIPLLPSLENKGVHFNDKISNVNNFKSNASSAKFSTIETPNTEPKESCQTNNDRGFQRNSDSVQNTYTTYNSGYKHDRIPSNNTMNNTDINSKSKMHLQSMQLKYEATEDKSSEQKRLTNEKTYLLSSDSYNPSCGNMFAGPSITQQVKTADKGNHPAYDNLPSSSFKVHSQMQPGNNDYVSMHQAPMAADLSNTLPQYPTTQKLTETSEHSSMHYNVPTASFSNSTIPSSFVNAGNGAKEDMQCSDIHYPSRDTSNYPHPQYYGNFYERNNLPAAGNYESQFVDYSSYGSYAHPHYRSHFHGNVYNTPQNTIAANPYTRWPPFIPQSSINEPCNAVYSTSYAQNSPQYNQWHNQR